MFDWHTIVGTIATLTTFILVVPYVKSVLQDSTKPNPVSWFGWALLYAIAAAAQASKGIDWSLAISVSGMITTSTVFIIALKTGRVMWTSADRFCIAMAILAIVMWAFTKEPLTALVLGLFADLAVSIPTIYKTYLEPATEPWKLWVVYTIAVALDIVATRNLTIYNLLAPIYSLCVDTLITLAALRAIRLTKARI